MRVTYYSRILCHCKELGICFLMLLQHAHMMQLCVDKIPEIHLILPIFPTQARAEIMHMAAMADFKVGEWWQGLGKALGSSNFADTTRHAMELESFHMCWDHRLWYSQEKR